MGLTLNISNLANPKKHRHCWVTCPLLLGQKSRIHHQSNKEHFAINQKAPPKNETSNFNTYFRLKPSSTLSKNDPCKPPKTSPRPVLPSAKEPPSPPHHHVKPKVSVPPRPPRCRPNGWGNDRAAPPGRPQLS